MQDSSLKNTYLCVKLSNHAVTCFSSCFVEAFDESIKGRNPTHYKSNTTMNKKGLGRKIENHWISHWNSESGQQAMIQQSTNHLDCNYDWNKEKGLLQTNMSIILIVITNNILDLLLIEDNKPRGSTFFQRN